MVGIESGSLKLILPFLYFQVSVLLADYIELAYHIEVFDDVVRVDVEGENILTAFIFSDAFLKLKLTIACPFITAALIKKAVLSPNDKHSIL